MQSEILATHGHRSISRDARRHVVVVAAFVVLGGLLGVLYTASLAVTYTSTATLLVNPSVGNPFVPTPSAVRQDELTSLETEAQVARSAEVLDPVVSRHPQLTRSQLDHNLQIIVPPSTQTLAVSYTAGTPTEARVIANDVAAAYLANRSQRFTDVNAARIDRLATQTAQVVRELRSATFAQQSSDAANAAFQGQLATALRNQLVNLRAQRTALENSDVPPGAVISPAQTPKSGSSLTSLALPVAGVLAGLALGFLVAALIERFFGSIRAPREVVEIGLPVAAAVPGGYGLRRSRRHGQEAFDTTIRRLRALILELDPRPNVITVAPPGEGRSDTGVCEAVAESFAKAGHRVVLVRADTAPSDAGLVVKDGLAQAVLYERLNVLELLESSREPMLCVLPAGGFDAQSREFLTSTRLRSVLAPLVDAGNIVVIQSPGLGTVEGEAIATAADLCLVTVTTRRTRSSAVSALVNGVAANATPFAALVVGRRDAAARTRLTSDDADSGAQPRKWAEQVPVLFRSRLLRLKR